MKRKGIKNLIVDFGGVLIDLDRQRCLENFRELGLPDVEHTLDLYHQQDFFQQYERGLISSADFRNVIREKHVRRTISNGFRWYCSTDIPHSPYAGPAINPVYRSVCSPKSCSMQHQSGHRQRLFLSFPVSHSENRHWK